MCGQAGPVDESRLQDTSSRRVIELLLVFGRLGLTSFGGPVAHLGYFRDEFVSRRRWFSDADYADLVALCQFLPGPASSQVGMAIGLQRAGVRGLIAAWVAFTAPSAIIMVAFAFGVSALGGGGSSGWLLGMKAAAVAIVAHAVISMAQALAPDGRRATIAAAATIGLLLVAHPLVPIMIIVLAAVVGLVFLPQSETPPSPAGEPTSRIPRKAAISALTAFVVLLGGLPVVASVVKVTSVDLLDIFYRAGALVFGGGHVVLPLLDAETVQTGMIDQDTFLAGYGAAQALPGPLFAFAGFVGASTTDPPSIWAALLALTAIFLPGALLIIGAWPFWGRLRQSPRARRALMGVNAAVVGILAAALYDPVFTQGITSAPALAIAIAVYIGQKYWNIPAWAAVLGAALLGYLAL